MTILTTRRLARTALIAALALPATALLPEAAPLAITKAQAAASTARTLAEFKAVLADYGTFGTHAKYGEIWVPTVTPQGWHPYPACQWVYTKNGWYFNDETPWGSIVHHYGRWSHDEKIGWFWIPDENWSPGWVVWRKSDQWIGWAPMPPVQEAQLVSSSEFNNDKFWTFMDAKPFFDGGCGATVQNVQTVPPAQVTQVIQQTKYITIFDLPPGLLVDVVFIPYWSYWVISQLVVIVVDPLFCGPVILPFKHTEKPPEKPADKPTPISTDKPNPPGITRDPPSRPKPDITIDLPPRGRPDVTVNWPPRFNPGVVIVDPVRPGINGNPGRPGKGDGGKGDGGKGNGSNGRGPNGPTGPTGSLGSLGSLGSNGSLGSGHIPKKPILGRWPTKPTVNLGTSTGAKPALNLGNSTGNRPTFNANAGGMRPSLVRTSPTLMTSGRGGSALR